MYWQEMYSTRISSLIRCHACASIFGSHAGIRQFRFRGRFKFPRAPRAIPRLPRPSRLGPTCVRPPNCKRPAIDADMMRMMRMKMTALATSGGLGVWDPAASCPGPCQAPIYNDHTLHRHARPCELPPRHAWWSSHGPPEIFLGTEWFFFLNKKKM